MVEFMTHYRSEMEGVFTDTQIKDIRRKVYALIDARGETDYDYHHIRRVEAECAQIAIHRGLDVGLAEVLGLLHDLGRVVRGVYGKGHSEAGAKEARIWLEGEGVSAHVVDVVCTAIGRHNRKKIIEGTYDELIKDADSMAHAVEFMGDISTYESMRNECAMLDLMRVRFTSLEAVNDRLFANIGELRQTIKTINADLLTGKMVHDLRVDIRSIRSLLTLLKGQVQWKDYKKLDRTLRDIFKLFEESRKLTVFKESTEKAGLTKKKIRFCQESTEKGKCGKVVRGLAENRKELKRVLKAGYEPLASDIVLKQSLKKRINAYRTTLGEADVDCMESIHQLRIQGKKLKYLLENDAATIGDEEDAKLLNEMHFCIGRLHDIDENMLLLDWYKVKKRMCLSEAEVEMAVAYYVCRRRTEIKRLKQLLFTMKKRNGCNE